MPDTGLRRGEYFVGNQSSRQDILMGSKKKHKTRHAESLFLHPPATGLGAFVELRSVMMKFRKEQQYCVTSGRDPSSSWVVTRKQHLGNLSSLGFASSPLGARHKTLGRMLSAHQQRTYMQSVLSVPSLALHTHYTPCCGPAQGGEAIKAKAFR